MLYKGSGQLRTRVALLRLRLHDDRQRSMADGERVADQLLSVA